MITVSQIKHFLLLLRKISCVAGAVVDRSDSPEFCCTRHCISSFLACFRLAFQSSSTRPWLALQTLHRIQLPALGYSKNPLNQIRVFDLTKLLRRGSFQVSGLTTLHQGQSNNRIRVTLFAPGQCMQRIREFALCSVLTQIKLHRHFGQCRF